MLEVGVDFITERRYPITYDSVTSAISRTALNALVWERSLLEITNSN